MHVIPLTSMRFSPPHLPDMYVHCLGWPLALNCPSSGPSNYSHSLESAWPIGCFPYILPEESPGLQPAPLWRQLPPPSAFFPALFILPGVHGNSWICKLILFTNFEVLSAIYISKNFFCLIFFFLSFWDCNYFYVVTLDIVLDLRGSVHFSSLFSLFSGCLIFIHLSLKTLILSSAHWTHLVSFLFRLNTLLNSRSSFFFLAVCIYLSIFSTVDSLLTHFPLIIWIYNRECSGVLFC